jgi:hypothetical protein
VKLGAAGVKPGARSEDDDGEAGAAGVRLTSTTLAEDDGGVAAGEQLDTAADDTQGRRRCRCRRLPACSPAPMDGAEDVDGGVKAATPRAARRSPPRHLTATSAMAA